MGAQKEQKSTSSTAFNQQKRLAACLLFNIDISFVSKCLDLF